MAEPSSMRGVARVHVDGEDVGQAEFDISASQVGNMPEWLGTISADDGVIWAAHEAKQQPVLVLDDGWTIPFFIKNMGNVLARTRLATIHSSGPKAPPLRG